MKKILTFGFVIFIVSGFIFCDTNEAENQQTNPKAASTQSGNALKQAQQSVEKPKITFIELGSVNCIPCRMMQPIMKSVEKKYGDQIKVIFYDVWKPEQKQYAQKYGIRVIPTQVFLNETGEEIFRHEGFFPEKEIDEFLQAAGLQLQSNPRGN
ncbi:MAG: hypothetical protein Kow0042_28570 [Calditrichia bacterium]